MPPPLEINPMTAMRPICPPSHQRWIESQEDNFQQCLNAFKAWLEWKADAEGLFAKHVYDNPSPTLSDFRQHRISLFSLLGAGERLVMDFYTHAPDTKTAHRHASKMDEHLQELLRVVLEWHTPPDFTDPVPDSFKQGMKEARAGKLREFPGARR
ncbi:MAG: hypothetical protein ACR2OZ_19095 [Verrucomicrobiales bacterium]